MRLSLGIATAAAVAVLLSTVVQTALAGTRETTPARQQLPLIEKSAELRITLGRALGEHAFLLMELMRAEAADAPEREAVDSALADNSAELAAAIGSVYGPATGDDFRSGWQEHIDLEVKYARAVAAGDSGQAAALEREIDRARDRLGALLLKINPRLDAKAGAAALHLHLNQMSGFAHDHASAYAAERQAYEQMFAFGDAFAKAAGDQFPDRFVDPRVAFSPAADLRIRLDQLLGEHVLLSGEVMRTGLVGSMASQPARSALDANSKDLAGMIGTVYGGDASSKFGELWRAHVDAYVSYIDAVTANDEAEKQRTLDILRGYGAQFGAFIASATGQLSADEVAALIHHHTEALIGQVNAFAAKDYPRAFRTVREAYGHMFALGDALAAAIARQFPVKFADIAVAPPTSVEEAPADRSSSVLVQLLAGIVAFVFVLTYPIAGRRSS